jgi:Mn-dependent DtxR family transcriptional regulator
MSIDSKDFLQIEVNEFKEKKKNLQTQILEFLKNNPTKAYLSSEIAKELNVKFTSVSGILNLLYQLGKVEHRKIYWCYRYDNKETV